MSNDDGPPTNAGSPLGRVVRAANQARRRTLRRSFNDSTAPALPTPSSLPPSRDSAEPNLSTTALSGSPPASLEDSRPHLFKSSRELRTRLRAMRGAEPDHAQRPRTRRRNDLLQTLLSFPEYDSATVAALLAQYDGDQAQVAAKLSQYRRSSPTKPASRAPPVTPVDTIAVSAHPLQPPASQPPPPPPHHISPLSQRVRTGRPAAEERDVSPLAPPPQHVAAAPPPLNLGLSGSGSPVPPSPDHGHGDILRFRRRAGRYSFPPGPNTPRSSFADEVRPNPFAISSDASSVASSAAGSFSSAVDAGAKKDRGMKRQRSSVASPDFGGQHHPLLASANPSRSLGEWAPGSDGGSDEGAATLTPTRGMPGFEAPGHSVVGPNPFGTAVQGMEAGNNALMERGAKGVSPFGTGLPYLHESFPSAHTTPEKAPDDARMPDSEAIRVLLARITKLETAFREYERESTATRKELQHRLEMSKLERRALEQRHKALGHELDENHKRGVKTEQYLDAMRRDLGKAIRNQQSKLTFIARSTVNNALYYFLAYLVPILAFLLRGIRDLFGAARRRTRSKPTPEADGTVQR